MKNLRNLNFISLLYVSYLSIFILILLNCKSEELKSYINNRTPESFQEIDKYALGTPSTEEESISKLSKYLSAGSKNDVEKARAIYRWITERISYDMNAHFSGSKTESSAEGVLKSRLTNSEGFSNLFLALASEARLDVIKLRGLSKGYGYIPGKKLTSEDHSWNVVKINDSWAFIDTTWGSGFVKGKEYVKDFSEHFFLTPPDLFITDHFPSEDRWQLLNPPITKEQFSQTPRFFPHYYSLGFSNLAPFQNTIDSNDFQEVSLDTSQAVQLTASLDKVKEHIFIKRDGKRITIEIRSPGAGSYIFKLYGKSPDYNGNTYPMVLEQKINFQKSHPNPLFPEIPDFNKIQIQFPKEGNLKAGTPIKFSFKVPNAKEIAFVDSGKEWKKFSPSTGDTFTGEVTLEGGTVSVLGNFGETSWPLLAKYNLNK